MIPLKMGIDLSKQCKTSRVKLYIFWRDIKEDLNERVKVVLASAAHILKLERYRED